MSADRLLAGVERLFRGAEPVRDTGFLGYWLGSASSSMFERWASYCWACPLGGRRSWVNIGKGGGGRNGI